jgi:hypothetical protein
MQPGAHGFHWTNNNYYRRFHGGKFGPDYIYMGNSYVEG